MAASRCIDEAAAARSHQRAPHNAAPSWRPNRRRCIDFRLYRDLKCLIYTSTCIKKQINQITSDRKAASYSCRPPCLPSLFRHSFADLKSRIRSEEGLLNERGISGLDRGGSGAFPLSVDKNVANRRTKTVRAAFSAVLSVVFFPNTSRLVVFIETDRSGHAAVVEEGKQPL